MNTRPNYRYTVDYGSTSEKLLPSCYRDKKNFFIQLARRRNFCDHPRRHQNMFYTNVVATKRRRNMNMEKPLQPRVAVVAGVWLLKLPVHKALKNELGELK